MIKFENEANRRGNTRYYPRKVEIKDYRRKVFDQHIRNVIKTYENIKTKTTKITLKLQPKMIGHEKDDTNFSQKFFLTKRQVSNLCKAFANY